MKTRLFEGWNLAKAAFASNSFVQNLQMKH